MSDPKIAPVTLIGTKGLCQKTAKRFKKDNHPGACWPSK